MIRFLTLRRRWLPWFAAVLTVSLPMRAQPPGDGRVAGRIIAESSRAGIEYASIVLYDAGGNVVRRAATDADGTFTIEGVPFGEYRLAYGLVGRERESTPAFRVDGGYRALTLGPLVLTSETVKLPPVEVAARREAFHHSIDRKTYHVGKDIQSAAGSVSDLLHNVPSVQVDIEGNVALRGDVNVLLLVDGKTSAMLGRNRAAVLEQMPADTIERIEVITNPSAKYKPDGTAGIINLVLKKKRDPGYSGSVRGLAGNQRRFNGGVTANFNPGRYNIFGSTAIRQDDRLRTVTDERTHVDASTGASVATSQRTSEAARPRTHVAQAGFDYNLDEHTKVGANVNYDRREAERAATTATQSRRGSVLFSDYDRVRRGPEAEQDLEFTGRLQHSFAEEDHEIALELRHGRTTDTADARYSNLHRTPAVAPTADATFTREQEKIIEGSAEYSRSLGDDAKCEAGYGGERTRIDVDFRASVFEPVARRWQPDATRSNRFVYDGTIHAIYGTYARKFGSFGLLAGLRFEDAIIHTHQVTTAVRARSEYVRLYPSLHLTYDLTAVHQLQLNYSHRVRRPDGDELNPFPHYQDPFNLRAGNPRLRPENVHSVEAGYQYRENDITYLATVYYRQRYDGMTEVSRYVDRTTLLTTMENLGRSRSGGLELGATTRVRQRLSLNFSGNAYWNEIDASNLGFSTRRSTTTWTAKLNASWDATKATLVQFNTNYTARRLTPQGHREPTHVANIGLRHNLAGKKLALIVSVSDAFHTLKESTSIDTLVLRQKIIRRRSSRIVYAGFVYNFGRPAKKEKDDLPFDNTL